MAKMFPSNIPDYIKRDKKRSAEIRIFELMAMQLPDEFYCYYSRPWHRFTPDGQERDGEADFVVAHPDLGVLVIEVKGGRISCREGDEQWLSKDRYEFNYKIKNPVEQARNSKYRLLELLKSSRDWRARFITIRHGVILPDNAKPGRAMGADAPLELFAFGDDLNRIGDWVRDRLSSEEDTHKVKKLGPDGMEALRKILSVQFELRPHLAQSLSDDLSIIERLTAEQSYILDALQDNPQMTVSGAAGTGKTVLAFEKALRSADSGERVLFVCFNSALAKNLKRITNFDEGLVVASFHELCGSFARKAGLKLKEPIPRNFYDSVLPEALLSAIDIVPELRFDAIIIDEGQDFSDIWLDTLRLCLVDPDQGQFYVFHDDNQRIFSSDRAFLNALPKSRFRLNRNLRNTRRIHQALTPWYDSRKVIAAGPEGEKVEWVKVRDSKQAYAKASSLIAELVKSKQLIPADIAVLTGLARDKCSLFKNTTIGGCPIANAEDRPDVDHVVCDTVRRFKGLDAKCVILIDIDSLTEDELIYVALSRGSLLLYVIGEEAEINRIKGNHPIPR